MTDGFEGPGATVTAALPAVVARVTALADRLDVPLTEVFDTGRLSVASGVPESVVKALLSGRPAGEPEVQARFLQRTEQDLLQRLAEREAAQTAEDPLERLLQDHGVRGIAWRAAQLPTDQHRDKVAEWLDMLLESVKRPES